MKFIVRYSYLGLILLLTACTTGQPRSLQFEQIDKQVMHVWPGKPDVPRYLYIGQLTGETNFKAKSSAGGWTSFFHWVAGLDEDSEQRVVLQRPQAGMTDKAGRIYVTDVSRRAIFVFDVPAGELKIWEWAREDTRFNTPIGITQGVDGQVLVADAELGRIFRLDSQGHPLGEFGAGILERPTGLVRDAKTQRLYVADTRAHNIKVFDDSGKLLKVLGRRGNGKGEFNAPTFLVIKNSRLYVSDMLNTRVQVFDSHGKHERSFGKRGLYLGDMTRPKGIAVDDENNIYVVESYHDHLLVFDQKGRFLLPIGGTGRGIGQFFLPAGVWTDSHNRIFVADMFNGRVVVFQYLGARE